jgi:branched-chain amino acid transport system substrate-binding protein
MSHTAETTITPHMPENNVGRNPNADRALCGPSSQGYSSRQKPETTRQVTKDTLREETKMSLTRRQALQSAGAVVVASALAKPAIAAKDPIPVGYLPALTGPSSSTGVGINRGIQLAVKEINDAGGIDGRQLELITRDTQSDPTKAVNGAAELTRGQKVSVVFGPLNSGESLAVVPLLARTNTPQVHPCWVDSLTDPQKYPMCFRNAPTNQQIGSAANRYVVDVLKRKKVALISDTTGYGTASVNAYLPMLKSKGADVVYQGNVDAANPDLKPELLRMQAAGAEAIMPWSVNAGFLSRIINTRGQMGWDVPIVGQTTLGSGQTKDLLEKPEYWAKVYPNNFRPVCYAPGGKLTDRTSAFLDRLKGAKIDMGDTLLWWIALGYDSPRLIAEAMKSVGTEPDAIVGYLNKLKGFPGVYGDISFTTDKHDGYPDDEVVMVEANSLKDGAFNLAPGYSA